METEECLIVVDFESTCDTGGRMAAHEMELIEIGAVKVRLDDGEILSTFRSFVRPQNQPILSDFCKQLTGIRQREIDTAEPFTHVLKEFQTWLNHPFWTWASWGNFDRTLLDRELERAGDDLIFAEHLNLKAIAGLSPLTDGAASVRHWDLKLVNALKSLWGRPLEISLGCVDKGLDPDEVRPGLSRGRSDPVSGPGSTKTLISVCENGSHLDIQQLDVDLEFILVQHA